MHYSLGYLLVSRLTNFLWFSPCPHSVVFSCSRQLLRVKRAPEIHWTQPIYHPGVHSHSQWVTGQHSGAFCRYWGRYFPQEMVESRNRAERLWVSLSGQEHDSEDASSHGELSSYSQYQIDGMSRWWHVMAVLLKKENDKYVPKTVVLYEFK